MNKILTIILIALMISLYGCTRVNETTLVDENIIIGDISQTRPALEGNIRIVGIDDFSFFSEDIVSVRGDIFNQGYFSIFDILVSLDESGQIHMDYFFDENMDTHVIRSINGMGGWWYVAYYDGGWPERNVFRMDHYPYRDGMTITIIEAGQQDLESYYDIFRQEVERKVSNDGKTIIPQITLRGPNIGNLTFEDFIVEPHNLRSDMLVEGNVTAIDAILTLAEEDLINYTLTWYESIGAAQVVQSYWVERINEDIASGRCGFVYEAGPWAFAGFRGNHIHIPSDIRIILSPEYLEFYWICL